MLEKRKNNKKITKQKEKENQIKRINELYNDANERKDLWKTKEQIKDKRMNEYCERYNATSETKTYNTHGGWKNKRYTTSKSQLAWKMENEEPEKEKKKIVKHKTKEAIILYDKKADDYDAYIVEIENINGEKIAKLKVKNRKIKMKIHKEEIENEELQKVALNMRSEIYILDEII